jgi:hypothetical protein
MIASIGVIECLRTTAVAQTVRVHGNAFDSLHSEPLRNATVTINGGGRTTTTDARGRFSFDSVAPGALTLTVYHAVLDTIGLGAISAHATVTDGRDDILVAVPSFATLWRAACGTARFPGDSGFVYGSVRDALTQKPVPGAIVTVSWIDIAVDSAKHVDQHRLRKQARSDASGTYGVCGVPMSTALRFQAVDSTRASGAVDLGGDGPRMRRRDLVVAPTTLADPARHGTVTGLVTSANGAPFPDARVAIDDVPEVRTGADGRFVLRSVPPGTRQISFLAVGLTPLSQTVDVPAGDTAVVSVQLDKVPTLDAVRVTAAQQRFLRDLEDRKRLGLGYVLDSTALGEMGTLMAGFASAPSVKIVNLRNSASRYVVALPRGAGRCVANLWMDGVRLGSDDLAFDILTDMRPDEIAAVEVYPRVATVPSEFSTPRADCGAVVVWTKRKFRP